MLFRATGARGVGTETPHFTLPNTAQRKWSENKERHSLPFAGKFDLKFK